MTNKVSFFIDGFNLYHSIKQYASRCRWLDLHKLCSSYLRDDEELANIYYFTALAEWNLSKTEKHKLYIKALKSVGITPVYGKFKKVKKHCNLCNQDYPTHEEKRTDVNIAMYLFEEAFKDNFDTAVIISGDSDLIPPIERIQANFPSKKIGVISPVGRKTKELKDVADFYLKMKTQNLESSVFNKQVIVGDSVLIAPDEWL